MLCTFVLCTFVLCTFVLYLCACSKQTDFCTSGWFQIAVPVQTFCTGLQISGNRCLYWSQTVCTVQFFVLVAGFRCLFVDLKTEQKNKLSFVFCSNTDVCCRILKGVGGGWGGFNIKGVATSELEGGWWGVKSVDPQLQRIILAL